MNAARLAREGLKIIVAHGQREPRDTLVSIIERRHTVICECGSVEKILETAADKHPDMIVTGLTFEDGDGIDAVVRVGAENPVPSVIVADRRSLELVEKAMADHVMAYLIEPIDPIDLQAAIMVAQARFEQFQVMAEEVDSLRQALADRKVIERAKGAIMADQKIEEAQAFAILRTRAQNARVKLVDVARGVLEHGPAFEPAPGTAADGSDGLKTESA
ncbi:MAG: ANTAR domain-containing response regulator [Phycisphaerales bacterium JB060]